MLHGALTVPWEVISGIRLSIVLFAECFLWAQPHSRYVVRLEENTPKSIPWCSLFSCGLIYKLELEKEVK